MNFFIDISSLTLLNIVFAASGRKIKPERSTKNIIQHLVGHGKQKSKYRGYKVKKIPPLSER